MFSAFEAKRFGGVGVIEDKISAAPETDVCALLPCFDISSKEEAIKDAVVLML